MSPYCSLRIRLAAALFKVINISSLDNIIKTDLFEHRDPMSARKKMKRDLVTTAGKMILALGP
jgi:hypothetical protein